MEKKKLLLVAISLGVFLVIVIGAAYMIFSPGSKLARPQESRFVPVREPVYPGSSSFTGGEDLAEGPDQPVSIDAVDILRNADGIQGLQPPPANSIQQENNFYINNGSPERQIQVERTAADGSRVYINVPRPSTAAVPDTAPAGRAVSSAPASKSTVTAAAPPARAPASSTGASAAAAVAARPAARPQAQSPARLYDTFWIQTGSFAVKTRAEGVKEVLAARGIASIIENRDINGKTFFRVRVGPYTSKNEADYWLSLVKSIEGFEDSQVWQNQSRL